MCLQMVYLLGGVNTSIYILSTQLVVAHFGINGNPTSTTSLHLYLRRPDLRAPNNANHTLSDYGIGLGFGIKGGAVKTVGHSLLLL